MQSRIQKLTRSVGSITFHSTDTDVVLGLVKDTILYLRAGWPDFKYGAICQQRITKKKLDVYEEWLKPIKECIEREIK